MKTGLKVFKTVIMTILSIYFLFIFEEGIRLKKNTSALPFLTKDETKYCISCIKPGEELEAEYSGIGYKVKIRYYLPEESSNDKKVIIVGKEFLFLNKFKLWGWIS